MAAHAHDASWQALAASLLLGCAGVAAAQSVAPAAPLATATAPTPAVAPPPAPTPSFTPERNLCATAAGPVAIGTAQWNGWGRDIFNSRYQPEPAIRAVDVPKLALKWAYGFQAGKEFTQPSVVDGRLFVAGSAGRVYALDAKTGCTYWTFDAAVGSHTAISIGELGESKKVYLPKRLKGKLAHLDIIKAPSAVIFGDDSGAVYALDAQKGTLLWKTRIDTHPAARIVGAPTLYNDRVYVTVSATEDALAANPGYSCCTFRGSVAALDIMSGRLLWKTYTVLEEPRPTHKSPVGVQEFGPSGAAVSSSPTIDTKRNVLYVGTGGSSTGIEQSLTDAIAAFDLGDGKLRWVKQLTRADAVAASGFASSPILRTLATGNQVVLAGQKSGEVYALDPDHGGAVLWQTKVADAGAGGVAWGSAADHRNLYVAVSGPSSQPADVSGSLWALDLKTGTGRWHTLAPLPACTWGESDCSHGQAQAVTVIPGSAFSGSLDGHLRAYSTIDGKIVWDFDTARAFQTVNGVKASGGPLDRGGATIVSGVVYIDSGNALLAFSVGGK